MKRCNKCGEDKELCEFGKCKKAKDGHRWNCRECDRTASRAWHQANKQHDAEYAQARRKAEPEKVRATYNKWRAANLEKDRERSRNYRAKNLATHRANARSWRLNHPEQFKFLCKRWNETNPAKASAHRAKRRARILAATGNHDYRDIEVLLSGQKGICHWCRKKHGRKYHVDHVLPLSKGGSNDASNLAISCARCNLKKHAQMPWEFAGRLF